ncbi:MAG: hypothetical protein L3J98_14715 [Gammaproteobacteria bacterium]|nr:hypothetical protein [Gammaproteobacteria bacterium]MCF6261390.1 hypothetical protein [Gammaproteobacteria bacterium]
MNWRILPLGRLLMLNKSDFKIVHLSSCLAAHCHTASSALDLFDTAARKPKRLVNYAKVMVSQPTQEAIE